MQQREQAEEYAREDREWLEEQERIEQQRRPAPPGL
jgi:hypothetical protein